MTSEDQNKTLLGLTVEIVSAHVQNNTVPAQALPALIDQVYNALRNAGSEPVIAEKQLPVVPAKRSVFPDYIICLEDGRKLKTLKRHLRSTFDMTPEQYREKWGLAPDYPMVAPNYAEHRSRLAKELGLGRKPDSAAERPAKSAKADTKASERHSTESRASESRTTEARATEARATEARATEARATEARASEARLSETRLSETRAADAKAAEMRAAEAKVPEFRETRRRAEPTAASVFASFPKEESTAPAESDEPKKGRQARKPFSKQSVRTMRS